MSGALAQSGSQELSGQQVVLVTGPSGAGRTTSIRALEDLGYEVIDNLPLSLLPRLLDGPPLARPLALGLDVRNRDFGTQAFADAIDDLVQRPDVTLQILYVEASEGALVRRYSETRRRHPLAPGETPVVGIRQEATLLEPVKRRADVVIDTSELSPHDLKAEVETWFRPAGAESFGVTVTSFSYKRGMPLGLDLVFDVRFLRNPHWDPALRALDGRDAAVQSHVESDPRFAGFYGHLTAMMLDLLPAYRDEGKAHLSIGIGCTGGQHRSVTVTERLTATLAEAGWPVSSRHRELERRAALPPATGTEGTGV